MLSDLPPSPHGLFTPFDLLPRQRIAVAVSGGGDSLALLLLALAYLDAQARAPRLLALTVDHRLRQDSAAEAARVAAFCARRGVAHRTLVWQGPKPETGLPAAARQARHALIARAAAEAGADIVLTGHTFDDLAETAAMRAARATGRGEAGIAPATLVNGSVWFVRPLLAVRRAALRDYLRAQGVDWIDDPTNVDMRFERARIRHALDQAAKREAAKRALKAAARREEVGRRAAAVIAGAGRPLPGLIRLARDFAAADEDEAAYALRILLAVAGGRRQLVDTGRAAALARRLCDGGAFRATLSRAVVDARRGHVWLHREARGLPAGMLGAGPLDWDGRYRLARVGGHDGAAVQVMPAGMEAARRAALPADVPPGPARAALAAEPAIREARRGEACPAHAAACVSCLPLIGPWSHFLPSFDLAPAQAAAALVGASPVPASPLAGHNIRLDNEAEP